MYLRHAGGRQGPAGPNRTGGAGGVPGTRRVRACDLRVGIQPQSEVIRAIVSHDSPYLLHETVGPGARFEQRARRFGARRAGGLAAAEQLDQVEDARRLLSRRRRRHGPARVRLGVAGLKLLDDLDSGLDAVRPVSSQLQYGFSIGMARSV